MSRFNSIKSILAKPLELRLKAMTDVGLIGFPKVGNTWFNTMLRNYLIKRYQLPRDAVGKLFLSDLRLREVLHIDRRIPQIFSTHALDDINGANLDGLNEVLSWLSDRKMIVQIRDPRDTLVSSYMHNVYRAPSPRFEGTIDEYTWDDRFGIKRLVDYYNKIAEDRKNKPNTIVVDYELLWDSPKETLSSAVCFIEDIDVINDELIKSSIQFGSMENMRKLEDEATFENHKILGLFSARKHIQNARKVRKGGYGGYTDHLSSENVGKLTSYISKNLSQFYTFQHKYIKPTIFDQSKDKKGGNR